MNPTTETSRTGFDQEVFDTFLAGRNEPDWIQEKRRAAFQIYQEKLTEPLDPEEYKRVDLRIFKPESYSLQSQAGVAANLNTLLQEKTDFVGHVAFVDGHCTRSELAAEWKERGVIFGNLAELLPAHRQLLEPYFMQKAVKVGQDRFSAWHAAFWTGGAVLYVPRNVELKQPLHSLIALSEAGSADFSHTLVILEDGASATLLEETASANPQTPGMHVGAVELILGKGAQLRYVQLQNWGQKVYHLAHQCGRVASDAFLQWTVGGLGAKTAHIHQDVMLDGRGAQGEVNGVTFSTERQLISYYTQQAHNAPDTRSDLLYKEVLRDKSRVIWRGMIKVEKDAQQTDGYQRCDALLLSPTSRADSIPGLEIEADDVRCTHGATVGRVDEEQVFYCKSRGLTEYEAMHMIVEGFLQTVVDRIPVEVVRDTLSLAVQKKLGIGD